MPKYVLPESGRGRLGGVVGERNSARHRRGAHMNFTPYALSMGTSMENIGGFIAGGRDGECESGNSSEEKGQPVSRVFRRSGGIIPPRLTLILNYPVHDITCVVKYFYLFCYVQLNLKFVITI